MGDEIDPVRESLVCSMYRVNGMSPCVPPRAVHSQSPVRGPVLGFFSFACARADAATTDTEPLGNQPVHLHRSLLEPPSTIAAVALTLEAYHPALKPLATHPLPLY